MSGTTDIQISVVGAHVISFEKIKSGEALFAGLCIVLVETVGNGVLLAG